jgi:hypothetical protein
VEGRLEDHDLRALDALGVAELRAILMAASFASRPELQKKTFVRPDSAVRREASSSCRGIA